MTAIPQIISSPDGDKVVVLALAEYERMRELLCDLQDVIEAQEIKRKIASGEDEAIPASMVDRLLDGPDSKIKIWREYRGLSIDELAEATGCSPAHVAEIESGNHDGSIHIMGALAKALRVDLDDLV
ncbi:MAG: helix-turn-helix transcriptional regulator [Magnetococcales bacterium]|nr:helix-turn-helix transcriptional regulator [Magnetococcales bacterium]